MSTERGVQFPKVEGRRSTTRASRDVLSTAAGAADGGLAAAIEAETDWRRRYPQHLRALTALSATSTAAASGIARAGLDRLHETFEHVDASGRTRRLLEAAEGEPEVRLGTRTTGGEGGRPAELVLPYRGAQLRGEAIVAQAQDWTARGVVEPAVAQALERVLANPSWLDLSGRSFALLGAGAEMGPTEHLLAWGADVLAVDIPRPAVWERLEALAQGAPGRLHIPVRPDGGEGADLLTEPAAIRAWLEEAGGEQVVGNYAYADGADFVRVAMAADAIITAVQRRHPRSGLAYLATPTDVFAVPAEAVAMARARQQAGGLLGMLGGLARTATRGRAFRPSYAQTVRTDDGAELGIADSLVVQQGPNYALAKRLQRWRAVVARQDGFFSAVHVAPATRTRSVVKNRVLAAAYAGAHIFDVEPFEPATSRALMSALLVHDLHHPGAAANPAAQPADREHDLIDLAAHSGLWRIAWEPRSALPVAVAAGARALLRR